jgi:hypothetical protein
MLLRPSSGGCGASSSAIRCRGGNLKGWRDLARFNAMAEPQERKGFVLPYQLGRARRFGRPYWFIPDDLV